MRRPGKFDVIIIGGGPAGACVALRLLRMGHQVALIEQEAFPRNQIGESLSPGVRNIFSYLEAGHLLDKAGYLYDLPANIIWETNAVRASQKAGTIIVNRSVLDADLLALAVQRGLCLFQPATSISSICLEEEWQVKVACHHAVQVLTGRFVLDARGRSGTNKSVRITTGLPNMALWSHIPAACMPAATLVEAVNQGWIWGSPVAGKRFRVMVFTDPGMLKGKPPLKVMADACRESQLFPSRFQEHCQSRIQTCLVQHYSHSHPWENNYLRLGECAFSLDPLSSSGVEKAMRFSLQAAIAVNTVLLQGKVMLSKSYFEDRLIESVVNHTKWTKTYYSQAWPGTGALFWKLRSEYFIAHNKKPSAFYDKLMLAFEDPAKQQAFTGQKPVSVPEALFSLWNKPVQVSQHVSRVASTCVIGDLLEVRTAIRHPHLPKEIAFIDEVDIVPLLPVVDQAGTFGNMIDNWSYNMPFNQAARIAATLWNAGILCLPSGNAASIKKETVREQC